MELNLPNRERIVEPFEGAVVEDASESTRDFQKDESADSSCCYYCDYYIVVAAVVERHSSCYEVLVAGESVEVACDRMNAAFA